jgi:hypothetical protein
MKPSQLIIAVALIGIIGLCQPVNAQPAEQSASHANNQSDPNVHMPNEDCGHGWMHGAMTGPSHGMMGSDRGWIGRRGWGGEKNGGGAHFHFARGNASIDIRCPADQAIERCTRAAGDLIDKIMSLRQSGAAAATKPAAPNPDQKPSSSQ